MKYVPIIKLKHREISKSKYIKDFLKNENIIPFLELRYELNKIGKNKNLNDFISYTSIKEYFLGIPHKPEIIGKGAKLKSGDFLLEANKDIESYFEKTIELFRKNDCIPVFYVYKEIDISRLYDFVKYGHDKNRRIGILATPYLAKKIKFNEINNEDFLLLDLNSESIKSQIPNLKEIFENFKCNIILARENRTRNTFNSAIELDKKAPLLNDLSTEITNDSPLFVKSKIYGFGDYCGYKNDISIGDLPIDSSEFYPAVALYLKYAPTPFYLGIKSPKKRNEYGFDALKELVLARIKILDPLNKTKLSIYLKEVNMGDYAAWNVATQWFYIATMSIYDDWKN